MRDMSAFADADEATQIQWAVGESIRELDAPSGSSGSSRKRSLSPVDPTIAGLLDTTAGIIDELEQDQGRSWMQEQGLSEDWGEYGLLSPADQVIIRPYGGDDDDIMLQELRPRFVVMYEPNLPFIRRLEVSRNEKCADSRCTRTATPAWRCACTR